MHDRKRERYRCCVCRRTFTARTGTLLEGFRKPAQLVLIVVGLLAYGCPLQAIVHVFGLDELTIAAWRDRAGQQCQRVHQACIEQRQLTLTYVQADELRVRSKKEIFWMGLAIEVRSRLWLTASCSASVDAPVEPANCVSVLMGGCATQPPFGVLLVLK